REPAQRLGVLGLLLQRFLERRDLALDLGRAQLQPVALLELPLLLLVLDQLARTLRLLDAGAAQRAFGSEVLARLQRLLVARVDLERLLVHRQRLGQLTLFVVERAGGAAGGEAARLLLGPRREHRERRAAPAGALQRSTERQVGALVQRIRRQVALV